MQPVEPFVVLSLLAHSLPWNSQLMKQTLHRPERLLTLDEVAEYLDVDK